jgi:hypothetical protein
LDLPAAWLGKSLRDTDEWVHRLSAAELADLDRAVARAQASGKPLLAITREEFPLGELAHAVALWSDELAHGRGFVLVRGVPVDRYSEDEAALAYWGLGLYLGSAVSQNSAGDLLGHVRDVGADPDDPDVRLYKTRVALSFHTDGADIIGLLCLKQGRSGGRSLIVSSTTVYNEILRRRPDLVELLYQPWHHDAHGQQLEGRKPYFMLPICAPTPGGLRMFYLDWYIRQARRHPEVPPLTAPQEELLELITELANDPDLHLAMDFEPGDIQLLNNAVALHARTAYEDWPEAERKRHLLRLWLAAPDPAAAPDARHAGVAAKPGVADDAAAFERAREERADS